MCIYYKALNKITLKNRYPLPKIDDLLNQIQQEKYFINLDLKSGYHQVRVKEEDTQKIAFKTKQDLYEWLINPFGLCNAPTMFMRLMNDVQCPFIDSFIIVYLDDIMVYCATWEYHISHLAQVLETLKNHQLLPNLKKCEFTQQSLVYLVLEKNHSLIFSGSRATSRHNNEWLGFPMGKGSAKGFGGDKEEN
eukprot:PITA_01770